MVKSGWTRSSRRAIALVAGMVVGVVLSAPSAGAGTYERPTYQAHAEWPESFEPTSRCVSDESWVQAYQPPTRSAPSVEIRIWHTGTGATGCRAVRESFSTGQLTASTFWVTPDGSRGRLVASGWIPCEGAGCRGRYVKASVDAWFRLDPTSTAGPFGAVAYGSVKVNGCVVNQGRSDNSETTISYGPL